MSKKTAQEKFPEKYLEIMKKFHLAPDFKLSDFEKEVIKAIDEAGSMTAYDLADLYDLRPSEVKELVDPLVAKGLLVIENGIIRLTDSAIQYLHASKEERKSEKKFRKFLNTLDEKDIDKFMTLVNSFKFQEVSKAVGVKVNEVVNQEPVQAAKEEATKQINKVKKEAKRASKKAIKKQAVKVVKKVVKKKVEKAVTDVSNKIAEKKAAVSNKIAAKKASVSNKVATKKAAAPKEAVAKKEEGK